MKGLPVYLRSEAHTIAANVTAIPTRVTRIEITPTTVFTSIALFKSSFDMLFSRLEEHAKRQYFMNLKASTP